MEENLKKNDTVRLKKIPGIYHQWDKGRILKFNMDEDEVLVEIIIKGQTKHIWTFTDYVEKII